jgi:hypothetical protein
MPTEICERQLSFVACRLAYPYMSCRMLLRREPVPGQLGCSVSSSSPRPTGIGRIKNSPAGAGLRLGSIISRTRNGLPPQRHAGGRRYFLVFGPVRALKPPLGHPVPGRLAGWISRCPRHLLALDGVF